jgi:hypothetical protein
LQDAKTKVLKKVWKKGVGFGAGKKDLSLKGLFPRPDSSNLIYRHLSGTALFFYASQRGFGFRGVFGPVVFGIAGFHFFAHEGVGAFPEVGQIRGGLDGTHGGGEQFDAQRDLFHADDGMDLDAHHFLKFDGKEGIIL